MTSLRTSSLAQLAERAAVNRKVTGSIPVGSVIRSKGAGGDHVYRCRGVQQWVYSSAVERLTADQQVPGSNPGVPFCRVRENPVEFAQSRFLTRAIVAAFSVAAEWRSG